jgi:catechol-2,3-dioxygenase
VLGRNPGAVWLKVGDCARLGLWTPGEKEHGDRGGAHVHFAMSVTPERLDELAEALGADAEGPVEHEGGDRSLYLSDPEGNVVEVWDRYER